MTYTLLNADCFEALPTLAEKSVDLVLVDLPYGCTFCSWDIKLNLQRMWVELKRVCKRECVYVFFCTTRYGYELIESNKRWFSYDLVWPKSKYGGYLTAKKAPMRLHEMIYVFRRPEGKCTYNPQMRPGGRIYPARTLPDSTNGLYPRNTKCTYGNATGERYPNSVLQFNNPAKRHGHPTEKPLDLCTWLIKTYSNEGDCVLDFTMGSGTTVEAALCCARRCIGIEKDPAIFAVAEKRIRDMEETSTFTDFEDPSVSLFTSS